MSTVSEDLLDPDWMDFEGRIGYDSITHKFSVQLHRHMHWFDTKESAEQYLKTTR